MAAAVVLPLFATPNLAAGRFADYFNHRDTADVKVVIQVVQNGENLAKRQLQLQGSVCETAHGDLCAHSMMLSCNSPVWKAQLERWQDTGEPKRIILMVEKGEEAAACGLVQCLYTACLPDIETEVDLHVNLGILMLADEYQVEATLSLCAQKLEKLTDLGLISWDLADRVMQLPAGFLERPGFSHLMVKIQEKILQHVAVEPSLPEIGLDLEVVMLRPDLEEALMALPLCKCASLLSDDWCRVASENTVAAAVVQRVDRERARSSDGDSSDSYGYSSDSHMEHVQSGKLCAQIMADVIRVPHLSSFFAAAMPTFASRLITAMRPEVYALGRELAHLTGAIRDKFSKDADGPPIPRCWLSRRRPTSSVTALEFDWKASAAEVADAFDAGKSVLACSPRLFFAGMDWSVELYATPRPDNEVGVYIFGQYPLCTKGPRYGATIDVSILAPDGKPSLHKHLQSVTTAGTGRGWGNFFDIPSMQRWDQSLMQKWTSSDGYLTLRVKVSDVL